MHRRDIALATFESTFLCILDVNSKGGGGEVPYKLV